MFYIADETIEKLIKEDVPYLDLTSTVLGIEDQKGEINFTAREDGVVCGTEEAGRIFAKMGIQVTSHVASGTQIKKGQALLSAQGPAAGLHMGWKVSLNILEHCSGIASRTRRLVDNAKAVHPQIEVTTTRKIFPGTKELAIKAVVAGGGLPHRLGLSETILIFKQHTNFIGGIHGLTEMMGAVKARACEKKVIVEVENSDDAIKVCQAGADGLQFDKFSPGELYHTVQQIRQLNPHILLIGTGGINETNIAEYAGTGIDVVSTTAVYFGRPLDIGAIIKES